MKRFIFQCNANKSTGLGHLSRCLTIAKALQKQPNQYQLFFVGQFHDFAQQLLTRNGITILDKASYTLRKCDRLILDDYQINQADIDNLRAQVDVFIKIDDFHQHDLSALDLVINFRFNAEKDSYSSNYQAKNTCLGLSYFPFPQQLLSIRDKNASIKQQPQLPPEKNIFIFIGGSDPDDTGIKLLRMIDSLVTKQKLTLISKVTPSLAISAATNKNQWYYLPLTANMADYYQQADLFISGGGLSKYEAAFCLIANACISQNEGQALDTKILSDAHLTFDLGLSQDLMKQPEKVQALLTEFFSAGCQEKIINSAKNNFNSDSTNLVAAAIERL